MAKAKLYITVGARYLVEPHPHVPEASPRGYVLLIAPTEAAVEALLERTFHQRYHKALKNRPKKADYPLGETRRIEEKA